MEKHRTIVSEFFDHVYDCGTYDRYPDISCREKWEALSENLRTELIKAGEEALNEPWTQLFITDFLEFSKSGNRIQFEDKYFPRRRKLNRLVMAECVENKGRFIDEILNGLYLILEETSWCLPPHNSYARDAKQENLPDVTRPIIDLFQAESGAEVAFAEYLLRPVFEKISPFISEYVNERLNERIFKPYLKQHFWWMGNGKERMCNWTPWCTQNVLICALTRPEIFFSRHERMIFMKKAAESCDYFLDEYGEDGGCNEGAQYYGHAALCLFGCLELIDGATTSDNRDYAEVETNGDVIVHKEENEYSDDINDGFSAIYNVEIIRNIANFILKMHVCDGYYVNFADCSPFAGRRSAREFLFGKATKDVQLQNFAAEDFRNQTVKERLIDEEINLFYHCMQAFAYDEMDNFKTAPEVVGDSWFESMGLMVARDKVYTLAAKAGNNADSHNHNDVGSFTIYKNGKPFIIDLGVGTYTQKTFSDKRYELWTMQSQFHNLPTFIDRGAETVFTLDNLGKEAEKDFYDKRIFMQKDGEKFAADEVTCILCNNISSPDDKAVSSLKMNISGAYDEEYLKNVGNYERTVSLHKGKNITVEDEYTGEYQCVLTLMTYEEPKISCEYMDAISISVGSIGNIDIKGAENVIIQTFPVTDARLSIAWKHDVYRILFYKKTDVNCIMTFT